jgi:hypothetical protein
MKFVSAALALALAATASGEGVPSLTPDNYDKMTDGKVSDSLIIQTCLVGFRAPGDRSRIWCIRTLSVWFLTQSLSPMYHRLSLSSSLPHGKFEPGFSLQRVRVIAWYSKGELPCRCCTRSSYVTFSFESVY